MAMILLLAPGIVATAQGPARDAGPPAHRVIEVGLDAFRVDRWVLMNSPVVLDDLGLSTDQRRKLAALDREVAEARRAVGKAVEPQDVGAAMLKIRDDVELAIVELLGPEQEARLDQIQLQVQAPSAFAFDDLAGRLGLSWEEGKQVRAIVDQGLDALEQASRVPLPTNKAGRPLRAINQIGELVRSPEYRASKEKAWAGFFASWRDTQRRIERALTDRQREAYRTMLGRPFDVETYWSQAWGRYAEPDRDQTSIAQELGLLPGPMSIVAEQRADRTFDARVAQPAYGGKVHPTVLFDEAHHNYHTAGGRYRAFADLVTNDGYQVRSNRKPFTASRLGDFQVLIIANAMGAEEDHPDAARPALTDAECDVVRDWVEAGGSLLLITDMPPWGEAADTLARRLGVDASKGITSDPVNRAPRGLLFSREKGLIGDHAITRGRDDSERVDRVLTFAGQSLKGPRGSIPLLKFSGTAVDQRGGEQVSAEGRAQGIAFDLGKGRVVVMGEAGQLSAQVHGVAAAPMGMNVPGSDNRKLALNTMHWLSRLID